MLKISKYCRYYSNEKLMHYLLPNISVRVIYILYPLISRFDVYVAIKCLSLLTKMRVDYCHSLLSYSFVQ